MQTVTHFHGPRGVGKGGSNSFMKPPRPPMGLRSVCKWPTRGQCKIYFLYLSWKPRICALCETDLVLRMSKGTTEHSGGDKASLLCGRSGRSHAVLPVLAWRVLRRCEKSEGLTACVADAYKGMNSSLAATDVTTLLYWLATDMSRIGVVHLFDVHCITTM